MRDVVNVLREDEGRCSFLEAIHAWQCVQTYLLRVLGIDGAFRYAKPKARATDLLMVAGVCCRMMGYTVKLQTLRCFAFN